VSLCVPRSKAGDSVQWPEVEAPVPKFDERLPNIRGGSWASNIEEKSVQPPSYFPAAPDALRRTRTREQLEQPLITRRSSLLAGQSDYSTSFPPLIEISGVSIFVLVVGAVLFCLWRCQEWLEQHGLPQNLLLQYLSIPVVSTVFTYFHIWVALYMTFYPLKYVGCLQVPDTNAGCGWQGIMPNKARKMARTSVELMTSKLLRVEDIVQRIDAEMVVKELEPILKGVLYEVVEGVVLKEEADLWRRLPEAMRSSLLASATRDAPEVVNRIVSELKTNIDSVFDLSEMVENAFASEPALLNHMFISCGYEELNFIRDCGAYMGGIFGIVQVGLWIFYSAGWMLPAFGFAVGVLTNWLALKMIFQPVEPRIICGLKIQGLFLKRQEQVSEVYAQIVADNVLYARNIIRAILQGRLSSELFEVLHRHVSLSTDDYFGNTKPLLALFRSEDHIKRCKKIVAEAMLKRMPDTARHVERYRDAAMGLEELLCQKLQSLPSRDFEGLLHPVFQEDEWKLVLMGGVLGIVIGCMQWRFLGS